MCLSHSEWRSAIAATSGWWVTQKTWWRDYRLVQFLCATLERTPHQFHQTPVSQQVLLGKKQALSARMTHLTPEAVHSLVAAAHAGLGLNKNKSVHPAVGGTGEQFQLELRLLIARELKFCHQSGSSSYLRPG